MFHSFSVVRVFFPILLSFLVCIIYIFFSFFRSSSIRGALQRRLTHKHADIYRIAVHRALATWCEIERMRTTNHKPNEGSSLKSVVAIPFFHDLLVNSTASVRGLAGFRVREGWIL